MAGKVQQGAADRLPVEVGGQVADGVQQGEGGVVLQLLRVLVIAEQGGQEPGDVPLPGVDQHGLQHHLQEITDLVALLLGDAVVGEDELVQILPPQGEGDLLCRIAGGVGGDPLAVDQVELGDDPAHKGPRLPADVTLPVDQQLIEKGQSLFLLADRQVGTVLLEDIQIGPQLLPALGGAGRLDDVAEFLLVGQHVHQPDVVLHRDAHQAVQGLLGVHQGGVLVGGGLLGLSGQIHVHPQMAHVVLEVVELAVDELIAVLLVGVHILQLFQDDLEGVLQGEENDLLPALFVPGLLGAEVGVDQKQGLGRQGLQLQIPGGVVGGNVADPLHSPSQQPLVGVVVVEEGDVLPRAGNRTCPGRGRRPPRTLGPGPARLPPPSDPGPPPWRCSGPRRCGSGCGRG